MLPLFNVIAFIDNVLPPQVLNIAEAAMVREVLADADIVLRSVAVAVIMVHLHQQFPLVLKYQFRMGLR